MSEISEALERDLVTKEAKTAKTIPYEARGLVERLVKGNDTLRNQ